MASTARWGLKHDTGVQGRGNRSHVGMASTARWGLKLSCIRASARKCTRRNGLYSPFGIETHLAPFQELRVTFSSEWPLQPVWD